MDKEAHVGNHPYREKMKQYTRILENKDHRFISKKKSPTSIATPTQLVITIILRRLLICDIFSKPSTLHNVQISQIFFYTFP